MSSSTNTPTHHTSTIGSIGTPSRRNTELALLVFAVLIPVFAYANVGLAIDEKVPAGGICGVFVNHLPLCRSQVASCLTI